MELRKRSGASARDRAAIKQLQRYCPIEGILEEAILEWQASRFGRRFLGCLEEAEFLTMELRREWRLGVDSIPNMTELLEERGIKVLSIELPENVSGPTCSVRQSHDNTRLSVVVVNAMHSLERRCLTLAHELGHRVFDRDSPVNHEKAANEFAGTFLVSGALKVNVRAAVAGYILRRWNVDCSEHHGMKGPEYHSWLSNRHALDGVENLVITPRYQAQVETQG